jgi:tryptophanyl-tRNA synthetase
LEGDSEILGRRTEIQLLQSKLAISRNDKDETIVDESMLSLGLFSYPVLQAADVLLYRYGCMISRVT